LQKNLLQKNSRKKKTASPATGFELCAFWWFSDSSFCYRDLCLPLEANVQQENREAVKSLRPRRGIQPVVMQPCNTEKSHQPRNRLWALRVLTVFGFIFLLPGSLIAAGNYCAGTGSSEVTTAPPWDPAECNATRQCGHQGAKAHCTSYDWDDCGPCSTSGCFCVGCETGYQVDGSGGCMLTPTCTCSCSNNPNTNYLSGSCSCSGTSPNYSSCSCSLTCGANCKLNSSCACEVDCPSGGTDGTGTYTYTASGSC
jgi:hypothetical protein